MYSQRTATTPEVHPPLFSNSVGSLTSHWELLHMEDICEKGSLVYSPYPRRRESLTICRWNYKGRTLSSVILDLARVRSRDLLHGSPMLNPCSEIYLRRWLLVDCQGCLARFARELDTHITKTCNCSAAYHLRNILKYLTYELHRRNG